MPNQELYRKSAQECLRLAAKVCDPAERLQLFDLATRYMRLADFVSRRHEHGTAHRDADEQHRPKDS
jgi:hypothetical protein